MINSHAVSFEDINMYDAQVWLDNGYMLEVEFYPVIEQDTNYDGRPCYDFEFSHIEVKKAHDEDGEEIKQFSVSDETISSIEYLLDDEFFKHLDDFAERERKNFC